MLSERSVKGDAVVIGAGTMGGGIAALLAGAGWNVSLLDVPGEGADPKARTAVAQAGLDRIKSSKPPLLFSSEHISRIAPGNVEDHKGALKSADWIVEAVAERLEIKRRVMALIEENANGEALISTNTSGLSLAEITEGRSSDFKRRFLGTHFFNPPRYLKLLELITLPDTDPDLAAGFTRFAESVLGRRVVRAKDTPGFISNRLGMWHLYDSIHQAVEHGLTVDEVDYLTGPLIGRPRSATFRLADIIGFDVMQDIATSQFARLPEDPYRGRLTAPEVLLKLVERGDKGEKSGGGFYKRDGKNILSLNLATLNYEPKREVVVPEIEELKKLSLERRFAKIPQYVDEPWGKYLNGILTSLDRYVRHVAPDIADDVLSIDRVMQWGFNWEMGPFESGDILRDAPSKGHVHYDGSGKERRYRKFGEAELAPMPKEPEFISLAKLKAEGAVVLESAEASLIDIEGGVCCLEFHTKMNTLGPEISQFIQEAMDRANRDFVAMVIGNQGAHFSAGFNLRTFLDFAASDDWTGIDTLLKSLQDACLRLKYSPIPVVAGPFGYTLGGGCEVVLHCTAVQAAAELYMGLPEPEVGVLPAGGGTKEVLARSIADSTGADDAFFHVEKAFDAIVARSNSASAFEAEKFGLLREGRDGITMNADKLLHDAKERALGLAHSGYAPPAVKPIRVLGEEAYARLKMGIHWHWRSGIISDHDKVIAEKIAWVLSGGRLPFAQEVSESYLLRLEREAFIELLKVPKSRERMHHTLETGKLLKN